MLCFVIGTVAAFAGLAPACNAFSQQSSNGIPDLGEMLKKPSRPTNPTSLFHTGSAGYVPLYQNNPLSRIQLQSKDSKAPLSDSESLLDYYDGLRAWDLGERIIAAGIWLRASAYGDRRAMRRLAQLYEEGKDLPKDDALAFFWFSVAGLRGDADSKKDSGRLLARLPRPSLEAIKNAVLDWKPAFADASGSVRAQAVPKRRTIEDLVAALQNGDRTEFQAALNDGNSGTSVFNRSPVFLLAVASDKIDFVRDLFDTGRPAPDPSITLPNGINALHIAAGKNNSQMVDLLLARGANPALEDRNGVRPDQLARQNGLSEIAKKLAEQANARSQSFITVLAKYGYIDASQWSDPVAKRRALSMFQAGAKNLDVTGHLDAATFNHANGIQSVKYVYSVRYQNDKEIGIRYGEGTFDSPQLARIAAMRQLCPNTDGQRCRFNFSPAGGCIGIVRHSAPYVWDIVSSPQINATEAAAEAMNNCQKDHATGCSQLQQLCAK